MHQNLTFHYNFSFLAKLSFLLLKFPLYTIIFFTIFTLPFNKSEAFANTPSQEAKKVIRIGYQPERAFFATIGVAGQEGYGYEYMTKILSHTTKSYTAEYIPVNWEEGFEMLKKGELDLLPFATYNEERAKDYLYSKRPLTFKKPILLSLKENIPYISSDYRELQGKKICVYDYNTYYDNFLDFLNAHQINAVFTKIPFKPTATLREKAEYDYILSSSLLIGQDIVNTVPLPSQATYIIANKKNTELIADIDNALEKLETADFLFEKKLAIKYFNSFTQKKENLSIEQQKRIEGQVYNVGLVPINTQLIFLTDEGEPAGICVDVLKSIARRGNFYVNFHILPAYASDDEINNYDLSFLPYKRQQSTVFPTSDMFAATPFILINGYHTIHPDKYIVGTLEQFRLNLNVVSNTLKTTPDEYLVFHTPNELLEAFDKGEVQDIVITNAIFNIYHDMLSKYSIATLGFDFGVRFTFSQEFPKEMIKIFNILLSQIDQETLNDSVIRNIALLNRRSISFYIMEYWYVIILTIFILFFMFFVFYNKIYKQKAYALTLAEEITPLTGLYTYNKFLLEARTFIDKHQDAHLRIITLHIVHFWYINENFGKEVASKVVQQVSTHIKAIHPKIIPIANYNLDQFSFVTFNQSQDAQEFIQNSHLEDLQKSLEPILHETSFLNFSIGIYEIANKSLDVAYMLDCAQIACDKSKENYDTHVEFFTENMKQESLMQSQMLILIKNAIKENEFELFYQPKFDINKMHVAGAEALIRWFKDGKMIPPDKFIPIAEKHGIINDLDYHVIELACKFITNHKKECLPHISINISGFTIIKSELVDKLIEITTKYNVKPQELDIEITETALVNNFDMALKQIVTLRGLGFTISMDDFGTGVSSLNRLSQMPLDTIKLDRVFLLNALENKKTSAIVRMVIELAKNIDATTVAEGIETQEQLDLLRELSCEYGQGYFYARPMPAQNFLEYLDEKTC